MAIRYACTLLVAAISVAAQEPRPLGVTGTVNNSRTGAPVKRALVAAQCSERASSNPATTFADDNGVFHFAGVPARDCTFTARKPGFAESQTDVTSAEAAGSLKVLLDPLGVISGKVLDQDRAPVKGASVMVLSSRMQDGLRRSVVHRTVSTDDRGVYRVWNLHPGKYYVKVAGKTAGTILYAGPPPTYVLQESFAISYFGGANQISGATPIAIEAGTESAADIRVSWQLAFRISGSLENFVRRQTVRFELMSGDEDVATVGVALNGDTGRFDIPDVIPGAYVLRAQQDGKTAERQIVVGGADLQGVDLSLIAPVEIETIERLTNQPLEPPELRARVFEPGCSAALRGVTTAAVPALGQSRKRVIPVPPGTHRVTFRCRGAYLRSAVSGAQDLLANQILVVQPGVVPPPIELVSTAGGGNAAVTLEWQSVDKRLRPAILLVPQSVSSPGPVLQRAIYSDGTFQSAFANLAPGPYLAYAFSENDDVEYGNPDFLKGLTGGLPMQIADKAETKLTIRGVVR